MENTTTKMIGSENFSFENAEQFVVHSKNFLVQICSFCNEEMELVEGATIYGDRWYHKDCWDIIKPGAFEK